MAKSKNEDMILRTDGQASYACMLESGKFADAEIHLGKKVWNVHRAIVCAQSNYFEAAFAGPFTEATTRSVDIDEEMFTENHIAALLDYLYSGAVNISQTFNEDVDQPFLAMMQLWHVADYFQVSQLTTLVESSRESHAITLAKELNQPYYKILPRLPDDQPSMASEQVTMAIDQLIYYIDTESHLHVVSEFRPTLLRLFLGCRFRFPGGFDDNGVRENFFQDWQCLRDMNQDFEDLLYPLEYKIDDELEIWGYDCARCDSSFQTDDKTCEAYVDSMRWWACSSIRLLCSECCRLPSYEELNMFKDVKKLEREKKKAQENLDSVKRRLLSATQRLYGYQADPA